jgi:two-component system, NtrC family, sensor kinase
MIMQERELLKERAELIERNKELTCLYAIARIVGHTEKSFAEVLRELVTVLPPAFQYPDRTGARIMVDDLEFATEGFKTSRSAIREPLIIHGVQRGVIEVVYRRTKTARSRTGTGFLPEERQLLRTIARQSALMIERKLANDKQLELENQLRHADRLAKVGQLTAGVAHELNEPLAGILGFAQLAVRKIDSPELTARYLDRIIQSCLHAREIIKKMMLFGSPMPHRMEPVDLNRLLAEGIAFIEPRFTHAGIRFECEFDERLPMILADPSQITQVLVNLVINAIHAMPAGGTLTIRTQFAAGKVRMIVQDTGTGMDPHTLEQIFMPFFTTKDVDQGSGLGLPVVHGIVAAHGAAIDVQSQLERGTVFTITFPLDLHKEDTREKT